MMSSRPRAPGIGISCVLAAATLVAAGSARAKVAGVLSPAKMELKVPPGHTASQEVFFTNRGDRPVSVGWRAFDWVCNAAGERTMRPAGLDASSAAAHWLTVRPERQTVAPNAIGKFTVTVSVPAEASGGHYVLVYFSSVPVAVDGRADAVAVGIELPLQVFLSTGVVTPKLEAQVSSVVPPTAYRELVIEVAVKNVGDVHLDAKADLELVGPMQDFVASVPAETERLTLLPGEVGTLRFTWGGDLPPASYEAIAAVYFGTGQVATAVEQFTVRDRADPPEVHVVESVQELPSGAGEDAQKEGVPAVPASGRGDERVR